MTHAMQSPRLGVAMPQTDMGGDPAVVRAYTQAAEDFGFDHLVTYDHVLGGNPETNEGYTGDGLFHDPFVLLGFMAACSQRIELSVQVLILPQPAPDRPGGETGGVPRRAEQRPLAPRHRGRLERD
ncbi:MAG: LLM class flavin-dependent oxidoreductase [Alphaproteobacteria bacterium]